MVSTPHNWIARGGGIPNYSLSISPMINNKLCIGNPVRDNCAFPNDEVVAIPSHSSPALESSS